MIADRPAPVSFNTGGNIVYGNRDPITGQITLDENKIPMELTPGQVQEDKRWQQNFENNNRIDARNFEAAQQQSDNRSDRLSRQRGRALELRNNRGDVFAVYYPYSDSFVFNYTGTNHSQAWKDAFESQDHRHSRWLAQPCKGMLPAALNGL